MRSCWRPDLLLFDALPTLVRLLYLSHAHPCPAPARGWCITWRTSNFCRTLCHGAVILAQRHFLACCLSPVVAGECSGMRTCIVSRTSCRTSLYTILSVLA